MRCSANEMNGSWRAIVVAVGGLDQADHAGGHEVLARDPVGAAARHPERDAASDVGVLADELVAGREFVVAEGLHAEG